MTATPAAPPAVHDLSWTGCTRLGVASYEITAECSCGERSYTSRSDTPAKARNHTTAKHREHVRRATQWQNT